MQHSPCTFLSKPEHVILTPTHAMSLHSEMNLLPPPAGGAGADLAGCWKGPPPPLPRPWKSGIFSMVFSPMNVPLTLFKNKVIAHQAAGAEGE